MNGIHEVTGSIPVWSTILRSPFGELRMASQRATFHQRRMSTIAAPASAPAATVDGQARFPQIARRPPLKALQQLRVLWPPGIPESAYFDDAEPARDLSARWCEHEIGIRTSGVSSGPCGDVSAPIVVCGSAAASCRRIWTRTGVAGGAFVVHDR